MNNNTEKQRVVAVVGPTASGKTDLGIAIAKAFGGEIISADSMQIYKGMSIATAAPTKEQQNQIPHHLVEFLEPSVSFSVADYVDLAKKTITDIQSKNKLPVIVGGTGLYIDSLLEGIEFTTQKPNIALRKKIEEEFDTLGGQEMLKRLCEFDPISAKRLSANDKRRIVRAFEIYKSTGISLTEQNKLSKLKGKPYNETIIGITYNNRELLYQRINKRVDIMLENGILEEAKSFLANGITAAQAIGHKEFFAYFSGEVSLEEATEKLKRETRRYAKRQLTWFRKNQNINWIYADKEDPVQKATQILKSLEY